MHGGTGALLLLTETDSPPLASPRSIVADASVDARSSIVHPSGNSSEVDGAEIGPNWSDRLGLANLISTPSGIASATASDIDTALAPENHGKRGSSYASSPPVDVKIEIPCSSSGASTLSQPGIVVGYTALGVTYENSGTSSAGISSGVDVMVIEDDAATEMSSDGELLHRSTSPATTVPPAIRETTVSAKVHFSARFKSVCSFDTYPRSHRHGSPPMRVASGIPVAITAISVTNRMVSYRAGSV